MRCRESVPTDPEHYFCSLMPCVPFHMHEPAAVLIGSYLVFPDVDVVRLTTFPFPLNTPECDSFGEEACLLLGVPCVGTPWAWFLRIGHQAGPRGLPGHVCC